MDQVPIVTLGGRERLTVAAAWTVPAFALVAGTVRSLATDGEITAREGSLFIAALVWIAFLIRRTWRDFLVDLVRLVLSRIGWIPLTLAAAVVTAVSILNGLGPFWLGISGSLWLVAAVAVALAVAANRRRFFMHAALLGLNLLLFAAADLLIGVFVLPRQSHNKLFVQHDPYLSWRLRPGPPTIRKHPEYESVETVNSWGFRTPEVTEAKPPGTKRILVVGDSHAEGYTVNDDETCSRLIERNLSSSLPVQVISLGVGGYSTDQEFLSYLCYGHKFDPDIVLLLFCENDIAVNITDRHGRSLKPVFEKHGETLVLTGVPVPDKRSTGLFSGGLFRKSSTVVLLEAVLGNLALRTRERGKLSLEEGWAMTRLILRDFAEAVSRDGGRLVVMNVFTANPDLAATESRLRAVLAEFSIPYLETASAYTDDFKSYWVAGHWNQKGQRAVADALAPQLLPLLQQKGTPAGGTR